MTIGYEAKCTACGETFCPNHERDLVHLERADGSPCGGLGEMVGEWVGGDDVKVCCAVCGSANVSFALWYHPNALPAGRAGEVFGSWNAGDNTFCDDCEVTSALVDRDAEPEAFETARAKWFVAHPKKEG